MPLPPRRPGDRPVPHSRLSRMARLGGIATGVAGSMLIDGARQVAQGRRPQLGDLLLTPGNVLRATEQLSQMRGAAMKIGQLLSMDAGEFLPPELTKILARLRSDAHPMPREQLEMVLSIAWGENWRSRVSAFDMRPIAAASIGQVHRATALDGRPLAVKVQYPGVRRSIDSDIDNVATLLRLSGLIPRDLAVAPLLSEAKRQLHDEADYEREAHNLSKFGELLATDRRFHVPVVEPDLSTANVLAMSFLEGRPIETLASASQESRDRVAGDLIDLVLTELFEFALMQTDPNLANYRYDTESGRIVLLDFGATRAFPQTLVAQCRVLLFAVLDDDRAGVERGLAAVGLLDYALPGDQRRQILSMVSTALDALHRTEIFDFADPSIARELREEAMAMAGARQVTAVPPIDTLFLQRKFGGTYLLVAKLRARVDVKARLARHRA